MAMKLDMEKAYDRLEWKFIDQVMRKFGYNEKWVRWIMYSISTVSFSILINGVLEGHIYSTRGIRQGDPISSFIFILCAEVLFLWLNRSAQPMGIGILMLPKRMQGHAFNVCR